MTNVLDTTIDHDAEAQKIWDDLDKKDAGKATDPEPPKGDDQPEKNDDTRAAQASDTEAPKDPANGDEPPAKDIWADAPEALKAAYDALLTENNQTKADWKRMSGTVSSYQRQIDGLKHQISTTAKAPEADPKDKETETTTTTGIFDEPDMKKFADDYPEVFGPMKKAFDALENRTKATEERAIKAEKELGGISQERRDANLEAQEQIVLEAHPDYEKIAKTQEFYNWYRSAPTYIKAGIERNANDIVDGNEVSHIVKLYKAETGISTAPAKPADTSANPNPGADTRRQHQLASAKTPAPKGPTKVQGGVPDDDEGAWAYFEKLDEQKKRASNR